MYTLLIILVTFASFSKSQEDQSLCYTQPNCEKCLDPVNNGTCAWCSSSFTCMSASQINPSVCSIYASFSCDSGTEESICRSESSCGACLDNAFCGWCDNQECLYGNSTGPFLGVCESWGFGDGAKYCSLPINCSDYDDCFLCTEQDVCGWCLQGSGSCLYGNSSSSEDSTCTAGNWTFNSNATCAGNTLDCSIHTSCSSCNDDPSDRCGWCSSTQQCISYDGESGAPVQCTDFRPSACVQSCYDFSSNCSYCLQNENCGWCNSSFCVEGNANGPLSSVFTCSTWGRDNCPYDCGLYTNQGGCTVCSSYLECAWCQSPNAFESSCLQASNTTACNGLWTISGDCEPHVSDYCSEHLTCGTCTADIGCSWCGGTAGCVVLSTYTGPCDSSGCSTGNSTKMKWVMGSTVIGIVAFASVAGVGIWYKVYWKKRHYYETLK